MNETIGMGLAWAVFGGLAVGCGASAVSGQPEPVTAPAVAPDAERADTAGSADPIARHRALQELSAEAHAAYEEKRYADCADAFARLGRDGRRQERQFANAASCASLAGQTDDAFRYLGLAIERGMRDTGWLASDTDLEALRGDARWAETSARMRAAEEAFAATVNAELYEMYKQDQAARRVPYDQIDWSVVSAQDAAHRERALAMIEAGALTVAADYFHAAMIFQHGTDSASYERANALAREAVKLDPNHESARWLVAATHDRHLQSLGKPQVYGTQYRKVDGTWTLEPIDEDAVTDAERVEMGVSTLAEAKARADRMNRPRADAK